MNRSLASVSPVWRTFPMSPSSLGLLSAPPATIKPTPGCRTSLRPPGCKWTLSWWRDSAWSPCLNCPGSHWRQRVRWAWGNPRCSWCTSCSSFSSTATWWCTGGRQTTSEQWRCWHTGACKPRCRTACRLLSRRTRCSRRDRWSRYPCQRSEGEGWNLQHEGIVDRQGVKRAKTYQFELRFAFHLHRQCGEFDFIWCGASICRQAEDIKWTQRPGEKEDRDVVLCMWRGSHTLKLMESMYSNAHRSVWGAGTELRGRRISVLGSRFWNHRRKLDECVKCWTPNPSVGRSTEKKPFFFFFFYCNVDAFSALLLIISWNLR